MSVSVMPGYLDRGRAARYNSARGEGEESNRDDPNNMTAVTSGTPRFRTAAVRLISRQSAGSRAAIAAVGHDIGFIFGDYREHQGDRHHDCRDGRSQDNSRR